MHIQKKKLNQRHLRPHDSLVISIRCFNTVTHMMQPITKDKQINLQSQNHKIYNSPYYVISTQAVSYDTQSSEFTNTKVI